MQDTLWTLLSSEEPRTESAIVCEASGLEGAELDLGWNPCDVSSSDLLWTPEWLSACLTVSPSSFAVALLTVLCLETSPSSSIGTALLGSFIFTLSTSVSLNVIEDNDSGTSWKRNPEKASFKKANLKKEEEIFKLKLKRTKIQVP